LIGINIRSGRHGRDGSGEAERVPGADHRRDPLLALRPFDGLGREGPDPAPLGEAQRGADRLGIGMRARRRTVGLVDAGEPQLVR